MTSSLYIDISEGKSHETTDVFQHCFIDLDRPLAEIPAELVTSMSIISHLRDNFHGILQTRRPLLFDIIIYLTNKSKEQVRSAQSQLP